MKNFFRCQVCGSSESRLVIDMGLTPLVNTLPPIDLDPPVDSIYDLALIQCEACTLVQLRFAPDMKSVFPDSYPYLSGLTTPLVKNFQSQASDVVGFLKEKLPKKQYKVLDVGSNDGSLLQCYLDLDCVVYGIEPTQAADVANVNGIKTLKAYFDAKSVAQAISEIGKVSLVTATNVFAHIPNPNQILTYISEILEDDGLFVSENHYLPDLIDQLQIDTIYHEHLRYYTVVSIEALLNRSSFDLIKVQKIGSHGGSVRIWAARKGTMPVDASVAEFKEKEKNIGINDGKFITAFAASVKVWRNELRTLITSLNLAGASIGGIGAPSRAVTLISYVGLNHDDIFAIGEKTGSKKIGKRIPTTRIPIVDEAEVLSVNPTHLLLLSWHIGDELMANLRSKGFMGDFIVPLPTPRIVKA
jgi:C-methyltransferase C-terminal domain/Methyltransferase domain/Putative zinc binding domain